MLDSETKRRIDSARDILVGKVPDPKSQVEQITIALIYKFMDDMDAESEELGGERKFFAGEFAKYGWAKLMRPGLGGHEMLALYADAIARMPENPGIPQLFRNIFNNAYLPYRDPETLRAFLKTIDGFVYDHSERLGDAFEYLLSVLGSQGDAGQFRTPRHIIEFMVDIVDPKKDEKVLDPACGTAGFLISAWKHILAANVDGDGQSTLTPDDRAVLANNFVGYDISPDMVRLSRVNMYLHGFANPEISEYDALTSEDKWNEHADVILANPPFMSPKGGIRPHKRFGVQSKRSEVLFVDYIAEHLTPNGRAAIIVPEGVIFNNDRAYVKLRKMLVEDYLVAVVSLPAGVFNPYSGVKTSILILDKSLTKRSGTIGFFEVTNDGFELGKQRKPIPENDLLDVYQEIVRYLAELIDFPGEDPAPLSFGSAVTRKAISSTHLFSLSKQQYLDRDAAIDGTILVRIGDVATVNPQRMEVKELPRDLEVSFVPMADLGERRMHFQVRDSKLLAEVENSYTYFRERDVLLAKVTPCFENGKAGIATSLHNKIGFGSSEYYVLRAGERVLPEWLYFCVTSPRFREAAIKQMTGTGGLQRVPRGYVENFGIPLPNLKVQREIVEEIEGYQKVIDGARAVVENYRPRVAIGPDWPVVELGSILKEKPRNGYSGQPVAHVTDTKVLSLSATTSGRFDLTQFKYLDEFIPADAECRCRKGDIYLQRGNTAELVGTAALLETEACGYVYPDLMIRIRADETQIVPGFLLAILQNPQTREYIKANAVGSAGSMPKINQTTVKGIPVPLPSLEQQQQIVSELEAERALIESNRELIERFEQKIKDVLDRVWQETA